MNTAALRAATPGARHARHFNAAGSALPSEAVLGTVIEHLRLEARVGGYEAAVIAAERSEEVYSLAARMLGADPADIALTESATVAWHRALDAFPLKAGDRILASASSYVSSALHLIELRKSKGIEVEVLPCAADGTVDREALADALRRPAALVTVAHVPTSSGLIEPAAEIAAQCRAAGVPLLLDATQSLGQLPLDVTSGDIIVGTGRKFLRGPRGTGLLYVSPAMRELMRPSHPDVRGAVWQSDDGYELAAGARRFETWETAHALRLGLGTALREALDLTIEEINRRTTALADRLRSDLAATPGVRLTDPAAAGGAIVTFVVDGEKPVDTVRRLRAAGVHLVSVPASHGRWDLGRRGLDAVVRASVHVYNDDSDVDALTGALPAKAGKGAPALISSGARADTIVIGAGVHGSSAAWHLAQRGVSVVHLDRFPEGHTEGSSHGHTRMIRRAYPNPIWDDLVDRAYLAWSELSAAAGVPLLTTTGGLYARPASDGSPGLRGPDVVTVPSSRFAGLRLGSEFTAVFDPAAGVLDAAATMRSLRELGLAHGVDRRAGVTVESWSADGDGVTVRTADGVLRADRLVVSAGPWTGSLVPELRDLLKVVRIVNIFIGASDPAKLAPPALGPFSVEVPGVGLLYGLPAFDGSPVKIGLDHGPADGLGPQTPVTAAEAGELLALARRFLPAADGDVVDSVACRYTMAPRNRFAVGALPDTPQVLVAAACSGHGFKFGPAIGAALADLALGKQRPDLDFLAPGAL
ncbi:aminotransferase class V-fold PLP-dependent enzyme [Actinoplanes couchii]|uniref:Aminotransferase class V n=1 Tax=Actinoplanes couchii TaxID=403638 RepID=A0ABQ3XG39_9ACTN|nr:aminotransferase class V-fold PLP-dependent enzyme [Actinoplanes couchii]MDR6320958.1 selenocysteine lyase/cysteine desulfurase/glycine/D-amino acid oxidase-like deaminating enzyme [Actinoplanes couchii]GID57470.1 hypothetical protein Aco03nite_058740 [Actinoplanes couchii]